MALHDKDLDNIHCHIILQNKSQITFETLKNLMPYGDIEQQRGSNEDCYNYLFHKDEKSKETEKIEYDETCIKTNIENIQEWLKIKQGQRTDLIDFKNAVLSGATYDELLEAHLPVIARHDKFYQDLKRHKQELEFMSKFRELQVYYIYGNAGTGKTSSVYEKYGFENIYSVDDYKHPFDEYNGEDVLLLDEYRSNFEITYFLKLLDRYPLKLRARYGNKVACYTKVYIISNVPLNEQYPNLDETTRQALDRRIQKIIHYYNLGIYTERFNNNVNPQIKLEDIF